MSDNIWGQRFWERNNAGEDDFAWHRLGTRGAPGVRTTVVEAMRAADVEYGVVTVPLFFRSPTDGQHVQSEQVAIVRPAWKNEPEMVYGYASNQYMPLQNAEMAQLLEPLATEWPVETVGAIRHGADVFVTLDAGRGQIGKDEMRLFYFVWNSHDGTSALRVRVTPVRVVCQNTCILGDQRSVISMDVRHTRQILQEAQFAFEMTARLRKATEQAMTALAELTKFSLTVEQVRAVFDKVYPVREPSKRIRFLEAHEDTLTDEEKLKLLALKSQFESERAQAIQRQLTAGERLQVFNSEHPSFSGTAWAVYNAITEVECWRRGGTAAQDATSVLMGPRAAAMSRAYDSILALR